MPGKMTLAQFGQKVKAAHPEYAGIPDEVIAQKVLTKYPQYLNNVDPHSSLTANPNHEGVYQMNWNSGDTSGTVGIPFSQVPVAKQQGFAFDQGNSDGERYQKDYGATPAGRGFLASMADQSGVTGLKQVASQVLHHPIDSAETVLDAGRRVFAPGQPAQMSANPNPLIRDVGQMVDNTVDNFKQGVKDYRQNGLTLQTRRDFGRAIPIAGPALDEAQKQADAGNTLGAVGSVLGLAGGLTGPELLKGAPEVFSRGTAATGDALQNSGANRMDRFMNGGKKLPVGEYDQPGRAVLESGPETSFAGSRPALTQQIRAAKTAAGPEVASAVQGSSARIPLPELKANVMDVTVPARKVVNGPLGKPSTLNRLDEIDNSFGPAINYQGTASPAAVWDSVKTMDKNLNWNKSSPDPVDVTANNVGKRIRQNVSNTLKDYVPEAVQPIRRYANLSDAQDLAEGTQNIPSVKWNSLGRDAADIVAGGGAGIAMHSPGAALLAAGATHIAPMLWKAPLVQTGVATGAFQLGRGLSELAPVIAAPAPYVEKALQGVPSLAPRLLPALTPNLGLAAPGKVQNNQKEQQQGSENSTNQQSTQVAPPNGVSSVSPLSLIPPQVAPLPTGIPIAQTYALPPIPAPRLTWGNAA